MALFSIGEVEKITGIKAHVLRYWEEIEPSLAPQKDIGGRRAYTLRDVQVIMRIKYLIRTQHCTISEARKKMIDEANVPFAEMDSLQKLNELRGELLELYQLVAQRKSKNRQ